MPLRFLMIPLAMILITATAFGQFWEATSGPPASTSCLITNSFGWVYAGTASSAVYRSRDWGDTWERYDEGLDDGGPNFVRVNQMAMGANNVMYAAVNDRGLMRSTDLGGSWQELETGIEIARQSRLSVSTKVTGEKTEVFFGYDAGPSALLMAYSEDGGDSFIEIPKSNLPSASSSLYETFLSPNSEKMFVLVAYNKGLYRTSNRGQSWTRIDSDPASGESDDNFLTMRAAPDGRLFIGRNALAASTKSPNAVVMRSSNDGESWEYLIDGWDNSDVTNNTITGISFGANNDVWAITSKSSGIFYSTNSGDTWTRQNDGLTGGDGGQGIVASNQNHVFVAPNGDFVYRHLDPANSVNEHLPNVVRTVSTSPNPATDVVRIAVELEQSRDVTIELLSVSGAQVVEPYRAHLYAGRHSVAFPTGNLPSGMYAWTMTAGSDIRTGTITIVR